MNTVNQLAVIARITRAGNAHSSIRIICISGRRATNMTRDIPFDPYNSTVPLRIEFSVIPSTLILFVLPRPANEIRLHQRISRRLTHFARSRRIRRVKITRPRPRYGRVRLRISRSSHQQKTEEDKADDHDEKIIQNAPHSARMTIKPMRSTIKKKRVDEFRNSPTLLKRTITARSEST